MNLDNINSVQDLINENEKKPEDIVPSLTADVLSEGFEVGRDVTLNLVKAALMLHQKWLRDGMDKIELDNEDKKANFAILARDVTLLQVAYEALNQVS